MKQYIIISVSVLAILLLNFIQCRYLENTSRYILADIYDIQNSIEREDYDEIKKGVVELENTWNSVRPGWDIFGEHDDIEEISEHIASIKVYAKYNERTELAKENSVLERLINHVLESEKLHIGNVL